MIGQAAGKAFAVARATLREGRRRRGSPRQLRYAYIISAYTNLSQVTRLVRRLHTSEASFLIHVDRKTDDRAFEALVESLRDLPSVGFLERHTCHWGGFGHVRATLKGIDALLRQEAGFDYAILLTGQDYPIKSTAYIDRFFESQHPKSFMAFSSLPSESWSPRGGLDRIEYWHLRLYGHHVRSPLKRRFPAGLDPYGGGAYWCLSRRCIECIADFVAKRPDVVSFFGHVDIPDEIFFQTVLLNS